jgi:hypothetical protein
MHIQSSGCGHYCGPSCLRLRVIHTSKTVQYVHVKDYIGMEKPCVVTLAWSPADRPPLVVLLGELLPRLVIRGSAVPTQPQLHAYVSARHH